MKSAQKPQDIVILLKVHCLDSMWTYDDLAKSFMSIKQDFQGAYSSKPANGSSKSSDIITLPGERKILGSHAILVMGVKAEGRRQRAEVKRIKKLRKKIVIKGCAMLSKEPGCGCN
ncbi:hypothetical protein [Planktothrix tepida]|uniref:hypothetical protein n=1 Tax=Planktothrix tepida TaxID=1678309 RepID=UPI000932CE73|nr:hypothetical protein [Planktothrix tepida]